MNGKFFIVGIGLSLGSSVALAAPLSFSEEAVARGINYVISPSMAVQFGPGLGLLDLDGDGDLDIILAGMNGGVVRVYENDGTGNFTDRSIGSNLAAIAASGIACADYDNDGDQDIFIAGWLSSGKLYRNDGNFVFTDVSVAAGVNAVSAAMGPSWADFDHDGFMDLYVPARTGTSNNWAVNMLFHNNGDGTFTDVAVALDVDAENDPTLLSAFYDFDRDGDDDLYLGTDKGTSFNWWNRLYRNDGGVFTEITASANAFAYIDCMGIAVADLNNDSYFDVYMTDGSRNVLFMHDGNSAYVDATDAAGVASARIGWGAVFADFDNDSFPDLYVCNMNAENRLYRGEDIADWPMADEGPAAGVDVSGTSYAVAVGDVNNDGLLDMLVGNTNSTVKLFINNSPDAAGNHMVRLKPIGDNGNIMGVGTCFNVLANGKWQASEARAGVNYKASEGRTVQFGLGPDTEAQVIEVVWPGGVIRQLTGVPADRTWSIYKESRLGDPNNDGIIDAAEIAAATAAITGPGVKIEPGVEIFDMDGDFDIDAEDIAAMNPCQADLNGDGTLDFFDISFFLSNSVDYNGDTIFDFFDISAFLTAFSGGCP
ncbi:MAG: CRTAC1 family protein [Phycisphaerales bacterium]|nr:CRTAC1 family protein [Phycisphaerales bacterium]